MLKDITLGQYFPGNSIAFAEKKSTSDGMRSGVN